MWKAKIGASVAFIGALMAAGIDDITKSVKTLGVRDWLLIAFACFIMVVSYGTQRQTASLVSIVYAKVDQISKDADIQKKSLDKLVLIQYVGCIRDAKGSDTLIRRCDSAVEGIRPWR